MASIDMDGLLSGATALYVQHRHLFPMYALLVASALFPIYAGAHASLSRPSSAAKPVKNDANAEEEEDDEEESVQKMEGLTPRDAVIMPLMAGVVLSILYALIKYMGASPINTFLGIYFSVIGTYSVSKLISDTLSTLAGFVTPNYYSSRGQIWKVVDDERKVIAIGVNGCAAASRTSPLAKKVGAIPLPATLLDFAWWARRFTRQKFLAKVYWQDLDNFRIIFTRLNIVSSVLGVVAIGYSLFIDKPWMLTNLQGFAVCYGAFQLMSPTTFTTGSLILSGLFFYDIWAVFFTPLMVTVAQNLDVPIKLVFPRPDDPSFPREEDAKPSYSMLGLGDIVLPGLMIALALRFDLHMHYVRKQKTTTKPSSEKNGKTGDEAIEKAPYVSVSGNWAEWFYTATPRRNRSTALPAHLSSSFPKPYFHASLVGYIVGMLTTLVVMSMFQHAQPALLYLVPGVLASIWGTGWARGDLQAMWEYTEAIDGEPVKDEGDDKEKVEEKKPEDAGSYFQQVRDFIFGASTEKEAHAGGEEEVVRPADVGENVTFSFTISQHSPVAKKAATTKTTSGAKKTSKKSKRQSHTSSASTDEDAVLVGSADLESENKTS